MRKRTSGTNQVLPKDMHQLKEEEEEWEGGRS